MVKRSGTRGLWTTAMALAVGVLLATACRVAAQEQPLLWARNAKGDSRPIQMSAEDAVTWTDPQGKRIFLLKGKVWIEQGDANFRAKEAVIWVDEAAHKQSGIYHLELFGDGGVSLELGAQTYEAPLGMIELNTRGVVNIKTFKSKVMMKETAEDALFKRAVPAMKLPAPKPQEPTSPPKKTVRLTSAELPAPAPAATYPPPAPAGAYGPAWEQIPLQQSLPFVSLASPAGVVQASATVAQNPANAVEQGPPIKALQLPPGPLLPVETPATEFSIRPRSSEPLKWNEFSLPNGEKATVFSGLIIRIVTPVAPKPAVTGPGKLADQSAPKPDAYFNKPTDTKILLPTVKVIELEADRVVVWSHSGQQDLVGGAPAPDGQGPSKKDFELYLTGNVEVRDKTVQPIGEEVRVMRCKEAYYFYSPSAGPADPGRNVAIALDADLELYQPGLADPLHVLTPELHRLSENYFEFASSKSSASKLPYGPGAYLTTAEGSLELKHILKKTIFDVQVYIRDTGEPEYQDQLIFKAKNNIVWLEGVPIFWLPYVQGDARDPLGPLRSLSVGYSKIFGFQFMTSWNVFDLIGIDPLLNSHWTADFDYFSARGFSAATEFGSHGKNLFGISGNYDTLTKGMFMNDNGPDILGGNRGQVVIYGIPPTELPITHPEWRGRLYSEFNWQELPYSLTVQAKLGIISDANVLDQYYNDEWVNGPDQATYLYAKQQQNNWAVTGLVEPRIRNWVTETEWYPKVDGYWLGQDLLDVFTYTGKTSLGFANLETTHIQPMEFEATNVAAATGRFDFWNELAFPMQLGAFKVVPYGQADFTYYTQDLNGNEDLRTIAGGGIRGSIPFSRLFPDIESELFNLNGIYHKIVLSADYNWVHSDRSHYLFPQLDQLNDNETDQSLRDIRPQQFAVNPTNATFLNSGFFDPQLYALRRLVDSRIDTLDSMETVSLDLRQRWQTKRGYPGQQHVVDWMTLDVSAVFFPQADRDDFGKSVNFVEYDWSMAVGDRTTLFSSGWIDPHPDGARVWSFGTQINRPDTSSLYLGYRQIDPLDSKQVIASVSVPFSTKYSISASTSYDFGTNTQINALTVTRRGTDLMVSLGLTYNSVLSSFGFMFEIYPNILPANRAIPGVGSGLFGAH